eukprot:CAMPEP_0197922666 /NCGR_PEP_ID=MMETSP1439-20131203/92676_1 /TAXON_ID=66791 /ORGANISM="Gonyaulax spinifera, Strain CCMP409" /LENGTH=64 /DNA_ID=CAMNT_0043544985 /DNA_START=41 /DNA_END=233 /DNA_ORIENTATION=-
MSYLCPGRASPALAGPHIGGRAMLSARLRAHAAGTQAAMRADEAAMATRVAGGVHAKGQAGTCI